MGGGGGGGGGGGPGPSDIKRSSDKAFFLFNSQLFFYRRQMVNFKEIYHFRKFQGGPTFAHPQVCTCSTH